VLKTCNEEQLMQHLGVVLYEYLGEEYPDVLASILGALKAIVNVIGMSAMTPPIKDLLPRLTPILRNRHERVQEVRDTRTRSRPLGDVGWADGSQVDEWWTHSDVAHTSLRSVDCLTLMRVALLFRTPSIWLVESPIAAPSSCPPRNGCASGACRGLKTGSSARGRWGWGGGQFHTACARWSRVLTDLVRPLVFSRFVFLLFPLSFELLEMLKAHKKGIRRATVNTFGTCGSENCAQLFAPSRVSLKSNPT